jgi:predicted nucleic acid-binding protein
VFDGAFDANVLLDFCHAGAIDVLIDAFGPRAHVAEHVRHVELGKGKRNGLPDPCVVAGTAWVTTVDDLDTDEYQLTDDLTLRLGEHHRGEAQTIAICYYRRLVFVTRDGKALRAAANRGISVPTTTGVLNELLRTGTREASEVLAIAEAMHSRGVIPGDVILTSLDSSQTLG